jgi:hypothetical protein
MDSKLDSLSHASLSTNMLEHDISEPFDLFSIH